MIFFERIMNLPFKLSTSATTKWLQSLSHVNSANAANQLNKVIKELRTSTSLTDEILKILIKLTPTVLFIISNIESSLLSKENPNVNNNHKIEQLCIQLLRNLSLAFYTLSSNESLSDKEKNQAIYIALQLIGFAQRSAAIYHQFSSSTLWQITNELYALAIEENLLHQEIDHIIKDFKHQVNIENVLKRNLLFTLLSPYQHTSSQIKEIFSISEQHAHLIKLKRENTPETIFAWNSENIDPPYIITPLKPKNNNALNIETKPFLSLIQSDSFSSQLNNETLELIVEKLSGFSETNIPLPSTLLINNIFVGFNDITEYLEKIEKLNKIEQLSSQIFEDSVQKEPVFASKRFDSSPLPTQSNSRNELLANTKSVKILQTQNNQFIIAETSPVDCSIGDIILLCSSNSNHQLGIIRQIKITNESGTIHILIETISGTVTFQQIESPKTSENKLISIEKENSNYQVLLAPCKLSNGTQIKVTSNKTFTLNSLVDYSPYFMHYNTA